MPPIRQIRDEFSIEDARLIYRNFSGFALRFNEEGDRNFKVILDEKIAGQMRRDGFNIQERQPMQEGDPVMYLLKVNVRYRARDGRPLRPPKVTLITTRGKNEIGEDLISALDWADIVRTDMMCRPYEYEPGRYSVYLKSIWCTLREDEMELRYADVPYAADSAVSSLMQTEGTAF